MRSLITLIIAGLLVCLTPVAPAALTASPVFQSVSNRNPGHTTALIADEVRHQLVMMPYYGVFDWIEAEVLPDDTVVLKGEVTRPTTKTDAEGRVKKLESVSKVVDQIEVLPLSPSDDAIRVATYRAIFKYDGPLFQYATRALPPIHIIVRNGRVTLKGVVSREMDKQVAFMAARGVSGVFEVKNELTVEQDA